MLKVNVGLSRKLSRDYNSTGFSVNLEGEITAPVNDSDAVIELVKELFDLAEESLDQQIERTKSIDAQASRDVEPPPPSTNGQQRNGHPNGPNGRTTHDDRPVEPATDKQLQFLVSLGKRQRLSTNQLEQRAQEILRRDVGLYDLSKKEAGQVIDVLSRESGSSPRQGRFEGQRA